MCSHVHLPVSPDVTKARGGEQEADQDDQVGAFSTQEAVTVGTLNAFDIVGRAILTIIPSSPAIKDPREMTRTIIKSLGDITGLGDTSFMRVNEMVGGIYVYRHSTASLPLHHGSGTVISRLYRCRPERNYFSIGKNCTIAGYLSDHEHTDGGASRHLVSAP